VHDFGSQIGGLIWVAIVVIGVVSSVVKNAKRQRAQQGQAPQPRPGALPPLVQTTGVPAGLHAQFAADAISIRRQAMAPNLPPPAPAVAVAVPAPVRRAVAARAPIAAPLDIGPTVPDYTPAPIAYTPAPLDNTPPPHAMVIPQRSVRAAKLFGSPKAILRSIIAAEVLGKPRALRDEY
jgi:hypothetical protein